MRPKEKINLTDTTIGLLGYIFRDLGKMSHKFKKIKKLRNNMQPKGKIN